MNITSSLKNQIKYFSANTKQIGQNSFNLGTFFLASALPISSLFFLIAIFISFIETKSKLLQDKWNLSLLLIGGLLLVNSLRFAFQNLDERLISFDKSISIYSLFNWIPLIILFISCQYYLKNQFQREVFAKYLISGTIPVLISCLLQFWFKVYGPFRTMGGLIVIFNKEIGYGQGVSGLFSNQNYTGIWLTLSVPLLFFLIAKYKSLKIKKFLLILILLTFIYLIFLTLSRNAYIGFISSIVLIFGLKSLLVCFALGLFLYLILNYLEILIPTKTIQIFEGHQINSLISKFKIDNISNIFEFTRINIWLNTLKLIKDKPIFGYGASTFSIVFYELNNLKMQHSHNMPLQLAYEFGIPIALLLVFFISFLFYKSWKNIFKFKENEITFIFNKCWLASCLVAILNHINDITYYDGKISILIWIFFSGLKCILNETDQSKIKITGH